jgi:hypothetical protein
MKRLRTLLTSKTVLGFVGAAATWLATQPQVGLKEIAQAAFVALAGVGVRDAIHTSTEQKP